MAEKNTTQPKGELMLRTLAMPADTNANGDIFGGWIVSQMDLASNMLVRQIARCRSVTVAIDKMVFKEPVHVGDTICVYCDVAKTGRTSIAINVHVWAVDYERHDERRHVTEGVFTFVAIDEQGKPRPIKRD